MGVDLDSDFSPRQMKVGAVVLGPGKLADPVDERQPGREIGESEFLAQMVLVDDFPAAELPEQRRYGVGGKRCRVTWAREAFSRVQKIFCGACASFAGSMTCS